MKIRHLTHLAASAILSLVATAAPIEIPTVLVEDAGNPADKTGYGAVDYEYYIGTYEVTNAQYAAFLNAVAATDPHGLYNSEMAGFGISKSGSSGSFTYTVNSGWENKPVSFVSFWDACRFANWLSSGNTEMGVYVLTSDGIASNTITRDVTAWANGGVGVASENEWYKAAFYSGSPTGADGDGYWLCPTQSNTITTDDANYGNSEGTVTDVGTYSDDASYYGTFDQGGNQEEWNDEISSSGYRGLRGGSFVYPSFLMKSSSRYPNNATLEFHYFGFRVTSLEPINLQTDDGSYPILRNTDFSASEPWIAGYNSYIGGTWQAWITDDYTVDDRVDPAGSSFVYTSWDDGISDRLDHALFQEFGAGGPESLTPSEFDTGDRIIFRGLARSTKSGNDPDDVVTRAFIKTLGINDLGWQYQIQPDYTVFHEITAVEQPFELSITFPDVAEEDRLQLLQIGFEIATQYDGTAMDEGAIFFSDLEGFVIPAEMKSSMIPLEMSTDGASWSSIYPGVHTIAGSAVHFRTAIDPDGSGSPTHSSSVTVTFPDGGGTVEVALQSSNDLQAWETVTPGTRGLGEREFFRVEAETELILVNGGTLSTDNGLDGTVVDTFYIGKYEVTWGLWQKVRDWALSNGYDLNGLGDGCADDHPVHTVSWYDVVKWCNAKSESEGLTPVYTVSGSTYKSGEPDHTTIDQNLLANGYRLPLEAEWEFAARGGNQTNGYTYSGSNDLDAVGWYWDNSSGAACNLWDGHGTWPVGQKAANELGLYDMSGNVWEWCFDRDGSYRHFRGGGWLNFASYCSVSYRSSYFPDYRYADVGFRFARSSGN